MIRAKYRANLEENVRELNIWAELRLIASHNNTQNTPHY